MSVSVDVVVPTIGHDSLTLLLASLDGPPDRLPSRIILVDDRRAPRRPLPFGAISPELRVRLHLVSGAGRVRLHLLSGGGRGPGVARNLGWQASDADWVVFLDDDVVPCRGWIAELARDVAALPANVAASRGRVRIPHLSERPRGHETPPGQNVDGGHGASADIAYRTSVLRRVGGFDERFVAASSEDVDLALRLRAIGLRIVTGHRTVVHPDWPTSPWTNLWAQSGNADEPLMRTLHGPRWRDAVAIPEGAFARHVVVTAAGMLAVAGAALGSPFVTAGGLVAWLGGTAAFARRQLEARPRSRTDVAGTLATSAAIPAAAVWHRIAGELRAYGLRRHMRPRAPVARPGGHSLGAHP